MKMKYKIYVDEGFLVDVMQGEVYLQDLERIFQHEMLNPDFIYVNRVLSNISNAKMNISSDEIRKFASFMAAPGKDPNKSFRWAILTNEPKQTALSFLIQEHEFFKDIIGVFSTLDACTEFLGITFEKQNFEEEDYLKLE